ncbi:MAG: peptide-methionine (R)-S-oxide reductase MsrB [Magnetococcales bacterium]|nr:peptide-methionine (R)-S-oxide reductase MsrB [Magnetococcales bacterium]
MKRRRFLNSTLYLFGLTLGLPLLGRARGLAEVPREEGTQSWLTWSEEEWRQRLPEDRFRILRLEETEPPFSSPLLHEKRQGHYCCAGCELPLFTSTMKYDSGTGWPSFTSALPERLGTRTDSKLFYPRTEYHCIRCRGHQGHLFDDGPQPLKKRYCNNGLALVFKPGEV